MRRLPEHEIMTNIRLAKDPKVQRTIEAQLNGCTEEEIDDIFSRHEEQFPGCARSPKNNKRIINMDDVIPLMEKGYSGSRIARELGFSADSVCARIRKYKAAQKAAAEGAVLGTGC